MSICFTVIHYTDWLNLLRIERVRRMQSKEDQSNKKRVPKGTSSYQAAWIFDDDEDYSDIDDDEDEDDDMKVDDNEDDEDDIVEPVGNGDLEQEEYEEIDMNDKVENEDELDVEEEQRQ